MRLALGVHGLDEGEIPLVEQDLRIRLWRAMERRAITGDPAVGAHTPPLPWSYLERTVLSAVRDARRRACAHHGTLNRGALLLDAVPLPDPDDVEGRLHYRELCRVVMTCLLELSPARRAVVRRHLDGTDRRTIARELGWTEGRVRNLLSRGLADLRVQLALRSVNASGFAQQVA